MNNYFAIIKKGKNKENNNIKFNVYYDVKKHPVLPPPNGSRGMFPFPISFEFL